METKKRASLKTGIVLILLLCWVLPVAALLWGGSRYVLSSIDKKVQDTLESSVSSAVDITVSQLEAAIASSRTASYDTTLRNAWRDNQDGKMDDLVMYKTVTEFLNKQYQDNSQFTAAALSFNNAPGHEFYCTLGLGETFNRRPDLRENVMPVLRSQAQQLDTYVQFYVVEGRTYLVRNLVDLYRGPYALLVLELADDALDAMRGIVWQQDVTIWLNDTQVTVSGEAPDGWEPAERDAYAREGQLVSMSGSRRASDFQLHYLVRALPLSLWQERRTIELAVVVMCAAFLPLLGGVLVYLNRKVNRPIGTLMKGAARIEQGAFGTQVDMSAMSSSEFSALGDSFNTMSGQLQSQFEHIYREELALRDARIMALQSQINPHFLNNTLEIINWEARMAGDVKVCGMLEALSTILTAAMDRDKRATVHLSQELMYVDAYLYIIKERLGKRLTVHKQIDPDTLDCPVPRLVLQPILENAVDHGIGPANKGTITISARRSGDLLELAVANDGVMTGRDMERIEQLLRDEAPPAGTGHTSLGIRNVNQRLKVLYGPDSGISINIDKNGLTICKICIKVKQDEQ